MGDPIEDREAERLKRMEATQDLSNTLSLLRASMNSTEFLHVDEAKMQSLATKISDMEKWMQHSIAQIDSAPLHQMPKVKAKDFTSESEVRD